MVFILAGLPLAGFGFFSIVIRLASANPMGIPAMACEGFLGFLGVLAMVQGIRSLLNPGRVYFDCLIHSRRCVFNGGKRLRAL